MNPYRRVVQSIDSGRSFAVGLILSAEGSTPREAGVRALIDAAGRIHGTLGGGAVEAEAQRRAIQACASGRPAVFDLDLAGVATADRDPICGGTMRVLVDPTASKDRAAYAQAAEAVEGRVRGALLTLVRTGGKTETEVHWQPEGDASRVHLPEAFRDPEVVRACAATEEARLLRRPAPGEGGMVETLVEPVVPNPLLLIVGGGHVGQALAAQAVLIGFDVTVLDDRPEFAEPALYPEGVRTRCGDMAEELAAHPVGSDTYIVIVTRGHQHDADALRACIRRPFAYVGMIGSRRKVSLIRTSFLESGWATGEEFDRVFAPIGLDIGAETVPEIAASIAAQLIAVRRRGTANRMPRDQVAG